MVAGKMSSRRKVQPRAIVAIHFNMFFSSFNIGFYVATTDFTKRFIFLRST
jgi:hypothetical protein